MSVPTRPYALKSEKINIFDTSVSPMNVVEKTKSAINALIDIDQIWIDTVPDHELDSIQQENIEKRLKKVKKNIDDLLQYLEEKK